MIPRASATIYSQSILLVMYDKIKTSKSNADLTAQIADALLKLKVPSSGALPDQSKSHKQQVLAGMLIVPTQHPYRTPLQKGSASSLQ
jgi:hypothetical protein